MASGEGWVPVRQSSEKNRPNNKLKLGPKIYVFHWTLYVCNNIIKGVTYSKLRLAIPLPLPSCPHVISQPCVGRSTFTHAPI